MRIDCAYLVGLLTGLFVSDMPNWWYKLIPLALGAVVVTFIKFYKIEESEGAKSK